MLFLGIIAREKCYFLFEEKVLYNKCDLEAYYVNAIRNGSNIINADRSVLLSAYVVYRYYRTRLYEKDHFAEKVGMYYIAFDRERGFIYTYCYTYYIENILEKKIELNNKSAMLNLFLEQYNYANTKKWVDYVRVSLIIEKLSYVASIFTLRKYGYVPNKDDYCNLFLLVKEIGVDEPIEKLIINILQEAFINKTYDNTTLFFLLRSLRNFMFKMVTDSNITNLKFSQVTDRHLPFSTSEEIFDFGELKMYIEKSIVFDTYSLQRGNFSEYNFIRSIKEELVYNYNVHDPRKFREAIFLLVAASMTRLSELRLIESIFINLEDTEYSQHRVGVPVFRVKYRLKAPGKEVLGRLLGYHKWGTLTYVLGIYYPESFLFFDSPKIKYRVRPSEKVCREHISYVRIDVYESKIRYNDKTLYFILPIFSYKCDSIPSSTGKIYNLKEIESKLKEGFPVLIRNIRDKENAKLDISIVIVAGYYSLLIKVDYRLSLVKKEQKVFRLDEFLAV